METEIGNLTNKVEHNVGVQWMNFLLEVKYANGGQWVMLINRVGKQKGLWS